MAKQQPSDFGIIRTVKIDGEVTVRQFDGRHFIDAMDEGIEIR